MLAKPCHMFYGDVLAHVANLRETCEKILRGCVVHRRAAFGQANAEKYSFLDSFLVKPFYSEVPLSQRLPHPERVLGRASAICPDSALHSWHTC